MFYSLSVKNFILIGELEIKFAKGLCVIIGETGDGKSILLNAILFCLGYKTSNNIIKHGKDYAVVNIFFSPNEEIKDFLISNFIEPEELLLVKVSQKAEGRKTFFNDAPRSRAMRYIQKALTVFVEMLYKKVCLNLDFLHNYVISAHRHVCPLCS